MKEMLSPIRWVIVVTACLWVSWFDFGLQTTAGPFFDLMLDYFNSDRRTTALVTGVFTAVNQGCGFIFGLLIQRFGITKISSIGSVLIPLGFIISKFATSVVHVLIGFGVVTAFGVSMMFVSSATILCQVCSGSYKKRLPLCVSIHSSCISLAGFSLPYLIYFLNGVFALPCTFLVFGGYLTNNVCVSIFFYYVSKQIAFYPLNQKNGNKETSIPAVTTRQESPTSMASCSDEVRENGPRENLFMVSKSTFTNLEPQMKLNIGKASDTDSITFIHHEDTKPEHIEEAPYLSTLTNDGDIFVTIGLERKPIDTNIMDGKSKSELSQNKVDDHDSTANIIANLTINDVPEFDADTKCNNLIFNIKEQNVDTSDTTSNDDANTRSAVEEKDIHLACQTNVLDTMFGHVNVLFFCVAVAVTIVIGTQNGYQTIIVDLLKSKGFSPEMSLHAYIPMNACALVFRILPGIVTVVDPIWFVIFCSLCGMTGQLLLLLSSNYVVCMTGVGFTGMAMGGVMSAGTVVTAKYIDQSKFAIAFGQILTGIGILSVITAPTYGAIRDSSESYDIVLIISAVGHGMAGCLCTCGWKWIKYTS